MSGRNPFTPAAQARLCGAADLQTSSNTHKDDSGVTLGVTLINTSTSPCSLQNLPQVTLLDADRPLDVQLVQAGEGGTPVAVLPISPGESVILILVWRNYCGEALKDGPSVRLALPAGESLTIQADASAVPRCEATNDPSTLTVNPYSYPP
jgi:hypothetical protein